MPIQTEPLSVLDVLRSIPDSVLTIDRDRKWYRTPISREVEDSRRGLQGFLRTASTVTLLAAAVRSGYVAMALSFKGYSNVKHLAAGYIAGWEKAGYPVVK